MFNLFRKKNTEPKISKENRIWIEENFLWLIEVFGKRHFFETPFILPKDEVFPYRNLNDNAEFERFFIKICAYAQVNAEEIKIKFFDDLNSMQFYSWQVGFEEENTIGIFYRDDDTNSKRFVVELSKSLLNEPLDLIALLSRELMHVKLIGERFYNSEHPDLLPMADLASVFFGFGYFISNSSRTQISRGYNRLDSLNSDEIAFVCALVLMASEISVDTVLPFFNNEIRERIEISLKFLNKPNSDTIVTIEKVKECNQIFSINNQVDELSLKHQFAEAIIKANEIFTIRPNDAGTYNLIGCLCLKQKNYREAIIFFNQAIEIEKRYDAAINNRGYAWLQLGFDEQSASDFEVARSINPENSFVMRNIASFHLKKNELDLALQFLKEAEFLNNKTELINFYFGHVFYKMGNREMSELYFSKSKQLNEFNDSTLNYPE